MPRRINGTKPPKDVSPTVRVEAAFHAAHEHVFGPHALVWSYGKDRKMLKDLVTQLGEERVLALIDEFFALALTDPVISRTTCDVGALRFKVNYLLSRHPNRLHPRTAENIAEAKKAMGQ